jgi:hypothetical protein
VEAADPHPVVDLVSRKAETAQLPSGNNAVLTLCQLGEQVVQRPRLQLTGTITVNCNVRSHVSHAERQRPTRGLRL